MSVCFFRLNETVEKGLKFSNVSKAENQISLRLASKQTNAIETYKIYKIENEKLRPNLTIYECIERLQK